MTEYQTPADRLERIASSWQAGRPIPAEEYAWLAVGIGMFLGQTASSLEEALGLRYGRGGVPWWRERALRDRDAALRALADECFADLSICNRSRVIESLARRYAASAWRRDRDSDVMPAVYAGTPRAYLWRAFKSGGPMPLGERQIRNIINV